jgi:hypothetical protein
MGTRKALIKRLPLNTQKDFLKSRQNIIDHIRNNFQFRIHFSSQCRRATEYWVTEKVIDLRNENEELSHEVSLKSLSKNGLDVEFSRLRQDVQTYERFVIIEKYKKPVYDELQFT